MAATLTMGIDLGTQSLKVICYDPHARAIVASASQPLELFAGSDGAREQQASDWISALHSCLASIDPAIKSAVAAIGVSGQQHGFVPLDGNGNVLAPVKLWCDTATEQECTDITAAVGGPEACMQLTGNTLAVGFTASKILWLRRHLPDAYAQLAHILLPHDYLNYHLTGVFAMEYGDASGTGLLDIRTRTWSQELLQAIDPDRDIAGCLPTLTQPNSVIGTLRPEFAEVTGLPAAAIVSPGGGDNMMAAVGTANVTPGRLTASLGTSGTLFGFSDAPISDKDGNLAGFCASTGGWLPLLCTMNCTVATEQIRSLIGLDVSELDKVASQSAPGAGGIITLPFFNGERTPNLPKGKAVIFGLDTQNATHANLLRSAMEAAVFGLRTGLEAFARQGMTFDRVTLTGGGSNSPLWRQICADILKLPVVVLRQEENAALGAALQALWVWEGASGANTDISDIVDAHLSVAKEKSCTPDPVRAATYDQIYSSYKDLIEALAPQFGV